ncbi:uncharacterized protein LOC130893926 [Diorhabda carinulata]|uniref:uncharacterized protein LOC130893926 n=1 Tax=Diorhabda carinulata TaxID=1163345 RepID=UPI0025A2774D|nr:uncharacterized protein LOC130893926 [Diorhabda carinulata]
MNSVAELSESDEVIGALEEDNDDSDNFQPTTFTEAEIAKEVCHLAGNATFCKIVKAALRMENLTENPKKTFADLMSLPTRQYLDITVVPILINALTYLGKERPVNPILSLAAFLIKYRSVYESNYDPGSQGTPSASRGSITSKLF